MFADSMLETSWAQRTRRSWTTLTSFGLQAVVIGLLLLLPLWQTVGLPSLRRTISTPISAGPSNPEPAARPASGRNAVTPIASAHPIVLPRTHTFRQISNSSDDPTPMPPGSCEGCVLGSGLPGSPGGPAISIFSGNQPVPLPPAPKPTVREFRTSTMLEGSLVRRVQPIYPPIARNARIQGQVVLFAVINKAGTIDNLRVMSGHPLLVAAAIDAVKQWQYRPYVLNHEPIEVETQITVNFTLGN